MFLLNNKLDATPNVASFFIYFCKTINFTIALFRFFDIIIVEL